MRGTAAMDMAYKGHQAKVKKKKEKTWRASESDGVSKD